MTDTLEPLTVADVERQKLQTHFGRFDILFFLVCTIVGVDTIATVAQGGGEAFTWMMIFAVVFFVPQALLFSELGTAFPQEGGPYYWTRLAFGHLAGAVNNFLYWITNPVWIGGTLAISCIGAVEVFFNHGNSVPTVVFYIITLAFVWVSIIAAITSFSVGKWVPTAGAFARFLLLAMFILTVIVYAAKHGAHGLGAASYSPTAGGFVLLIGVRPGEHRQPRPQQLLVGRAKVMAPLGGGAQRLLVRQRHAAAAGEQAEAMLQAAAQLLQRQRAQLHGGQLDRQRDAVQAPAQPDHVAAVGGGDGEAGRDRRGPLGEQLHRVAATPPAGPRVRDRQRRHRAAVLARCRSSVPSRARRRARSR